MYLCSTFNISVPYQYFWFISIFNVKGTFYFTDVFAVDKGPDIKKKKQKQSEWYTYQMRQFNKKTVKIIKKFQNLIVDFLNKKLILFLLKLHSLIIFNRMWFIKLIKYLTKWTKNPSITLNILSNFSEIYELWHD